MVAEGGKTSRWWHWGTPLAAAAAGALMATSAVHAQGTDLRPGRYTDLASLAANEARDAQRLKDRVSTLSAQNEALTQQVAGGAVKQARRRADALKPVAGLTAIAGPGVRVTLSDAPLSVSENSTRNINDFIVHQQDLQAVVNALWGAGARGITIAGQRIVTTTGIKCEGNSVQIQGALYPEPYVIEAVGNPVALDHSLAQDPNVLGFRIMAADPTVQLGWDQEDLSSLTLPAYTGPMTMNYARPLG